MYNHGITDALHAKNLHRQRRRRTRFHPLHREERLSLRLRKVDKITYCEQANTPILAEIQLTAIIIADDSGTADAFYSTLDLSQIPIIKPSPVDTSHCEPSGVSASDVPLQEDTLWPDSDFPHYWIDLYSYQTPTDLTPYVMESDGLYASIFPGCRHFLFFGSEKEVMYHIVEEHIEPAKKQFVCINCGTEFDDSGEAERHRINESMQEVTQQNYTDCQRTDPYAESQLDQPSEEKIILSP